MKIDSTALPLFSFVGPDGDTEQVNFSAQTARLNALASVLADRFASDAAIGILAQTGPDLVFSWLAAIRAGLKPLILQYPTKKQSRIFWATALKSAQSTVDLVGIICENDLGEKLPLDLPVLTMRELHTKAATRVTDNSPFCLTDFTILQMSSGTTGHRKTIEFSDQQLGQHIADYNSVIGLSAASDVIVSWLPLYHDMGFIACFVMPLVLGIPVVLIDPVTWVENPALLFEAIEKNRGTICYMPNFGFEVMRNHAAPDVGKMRYWVNCSEPISAATCKDFCTDTNTHPETLVSCYAMAENVFAVALKTGMTRADFTADGPVSCGALLPNVDVEIADDGELWIKSPASLASYLGQAKICNAQGYYPSGDIGYIQNEELFISGRKQDIVVQAGKKFMLSDIDLVLNRLAPDVAGRGVACQQYLPKLGTHGVLVLIEDKQFYRRSDGPGLATQLQDETGAALLTVAFVPPRFLTKTSSGKFNRTRCVSDYNLHLAAQTTKGVVSDPLADLRATFGDSDWAAAVGGILDSLSLTVLHLILAEAGIAFDRTQSLQDFADLLGQSQPENITNEIVGDLPAFHIVSIADGAVSGRITEADIKALGRRLGARVTLEHICLPPPAFLLSDLVFHDYFQPRVNGPEYENVSRAMNALRSASLILSDDMASLAIGRRQYFPVLSHNMERDPNADLNILRWQRYTKNHDKLPVTLVSGSVLSPASHAQAHADLAAYLNAPIFRVSLLPLFKSVTPDWELLRHEWTGGVREAGAAITGAYLVGEIADWVERKGIKLAPQKGSQNTPIRHVELAHFCSNFARIDVLEKIISQYSSFCIVGQPASVAILPKMIEQQGKSWVRAASFAPEALGAIEDDFDAILICGPQGPYKTTKPTFSIMPSGIHQKDMENVTDAKLTNIGPVYSLVSDVIGSAWLGVEDAEPETSENKKSREDAHQALARGQNIAFINQRKRRLDIAERKGDDREIKAAKALLLASTNFDLHCPDFEETYARKKQGMNTKLRYIAGVSLPRSGHHLLGRSLKQYFGARFNHCEFYSPKIECCRSFPCKWPEKTSFSKNHDVNRDLPQLPEQPYLIQYRAFLPAALSNFELHIRNGFPDTAESLKHFLSAQFGVWQSFVEKWVTSPFGQDQLIVEYSQFMASPMETLSKVVQYFDPQNDVDVERLQQIVNTIPGIAVKDKEVVVTAGQGVKDTRRIEDHRFFDEKLFATVNDLNLTRELIYKVALAEGVALPNEDMILYLQSKASAKAVAVELKMPVDPASLR